MKSSANEATAGYVNHDPEATQPPPLNQTVRNLAQQRQRSLHNAKEWIADFRQELDAAQNTNEGCENAQTNNTQKNP